MTPSTTPETGRQRISACAFIYSVIDDKTYVFMAQRSPRKKFYPGAYELPGGLINFNESVPDGLQRTIKDTFGMEIAVGDPFAAYTYVYPPKNEHIVRIAYFAQFASPMEHFNLDPKQHIRAVWVAGDELDKIFTDNRGAEDDEIRIVTKGFIDHITKPLRERNYAGHQRRAVRKTG